MSGAFSFQMNGFKYRINGPLYNRATTDPVGYFRKSNMSRAVPNAFETANELKGEFIAHLFPDGVGSGAAGDFMFDPFLASANASGVIQVNSEKYKPFLAIVNIPEITGILTPFLNPDQTMSDAAFKSIRDITTTLGVFRKDNFYNQFAIPEYLDPVLVTFGDAANLENPIFISPLITGEISLGGKEKSKGRVTTVGVAKTGYYNQCRKAGKSKKKANTGLQATTAAVKTPTPGAQTATNVAPAGTPGAPPSPLTPAQKQPPKLSQKQLAAIVAKDLGGQPQPMGPQTNAATRKVQAKINAVAKGKSTGNTVPQAGFGSGGLLNLAAAPQQAVVNTNLQQDVDKETNLIFPIGTAATTRSQLCKKASGGGGSLVGKQAGPFKIINRNSNGDYLVYSRDKQAITNGVKFARRPFAPLNIVLHDSAAPAGVAESLYATFAQNEDGRGVSSHYIIGEDGKIIETLNPLRYAGKHSAYGWNNFSIGIDMSCQAYLDPTAFKNHPRYTGDVDKYIGRATTDYLPVQPTSDPYPWNARSSIDLSRLNPPYLTRNRNNKAGNKMFLDYTKPQKEALYALIKLLLKLFKNTISNRCVLIKNIGKFPNYLGNYPQAFSGVVAHTQIEDPERRGDGHRAIDLLVRQKILEDISEFDISSWTPKKPGPYWDQRLK